MDLVRYAKRSMPGGLLEGMLVLRALLFVGTRYTCPCCGWRLRAFTHGGGSFRVRPLGYCPRCHSKARHRRIWLYLEQKTDLFSARLCLLHVSPKYSFSRRFRRLPNLDYVALDLEQRRNVSIEADLVATPIQPDTFDAVICVHVLEEIEQDRAAMAELFRVLKPGGWALITVPLQLDEKTFEDPTITAPEERRRAFGEIAHVRAYGRDLVDRLESCGFWVELDLGTEVGPHVMTRYGLRDDEHILFCTKA